MTVALHQDNELAYFEEDVRQRPNGSRVLRLVRELTYLDGHLSSSLRKAWEFPLTTSALVAGILLVGGVLPMALGVPVKSSERNDQHARSSLHGLRSSPPTAQVEELHPWLYPSHTALVGQVANESQAPTF